MTLWRHIPFLPERWEASDEGQIRTLAYEREINFRGGLSKHTRLMPERILKQRIGKASDTAAFVQPLVTIYYGTGRKNPASVTYPVARLVCAAFHGVPFDRRNQRELQKWRVRFLDGDVMNTHALNLEWSYRVGENCIDTADRQSLYLENIEKMRQQDAGSVLARLYEEAVA